MSPATVQLEALHSLAPPRLAAPRGTGLRVIAIGAHPDDYEVGAAVRLIHHVRMRDTVIGVICSRGEQGGDPETRIAEAIRAAEFIGMQELHILAFRDTRFPEVSAIKDAVEEIIAKVNPSIVYTHFAEDRHQDHRSTAVASAIACRRVPSILAYLSPSTILTSFQPHLFHVGSERDFRLKQEAIAMYQSQTGREQGIVLDQIMLDSRFYGSFIDRYSRVPIYAEPFWANHFILNCRDVE